MHLFNQHRPEQTNKNNPRYILNSKQKEQKQQWAIGYKNKDTILPRKTKHRNLSYLHQHPQDTKDPNKPPKSNNSLSLYLNPNLSCSARWILWIHIALYITEASTFFFDSTTRDSSWWFDVLVWEAVEVAFTEGWDLVITFVGRFCWGTKGCVFLVQPGKQLPPKLIQIGCCCFFVCVVVLKKLWPRVVN